MRLELGFQHITFFTKIDNSTITKVTPSYNFTTLKNLDIIKLQSLLLIICNIKLMRNYSCIQIKSIFEDMINELKNLN